MTDAQCIAIIASARTGYLPGDIDREIERAQRIMATAAQVVEKARKAEADKPVTLQIFGGGIGHVVFEELLRSPGRIRRKQSTWRRIVSATTGLVEEIARDAKGRLIRKRRAPTG